LQAPRDGMLASNCGELVIDRGDARVERRTSSSSSQTAWRTSPGRSTAASSSNAGMRCNAVRAPAPSGRPKPPRNGPLKTRRVGNGSAHSGNSSCVPPLLSAIAEKAKQQKTITRPLITAVLETITVRDDDITTWCGPIAKLPTDPERHYLIQCNESGLHGSRLAR